MGFLDSGGLAHVWEKVKTALSAKQDKLTGTAGQVVGFDAVGQAVAQAAPEGGMTQEEADGRYLKLSGGTVKYVMLEEESDQSIGSVFLKSTSGGVLNIESSYEDKIDGYGKVGAATIRGVRTPTSDNDAATKGYVDGKITFGTAALTAGTSPLASGTLYVQYE